MILDGVLFVGRQEGARDLLRRAVLERRPFDAMHGSEACARVAVAGDADRK